MVFLTVGELGLLALSIGLSLVSSLFLKKKNKSPIVDKEASTTASRGDYVPRVIGLRRVGAVIGWVGNRKLRKEKTASGKGFFSSDTETEVFYESAIHWLCVGPGTFLNRIYMDGQIIYDTQITPTSHPSGTTVTVGGTSGAFGTIENAQGTLKIYWGEASQPVNDLASLNLNPPFAVASRFPYIMYVHWLSKKLGSSPRWSVIDYEVGCLPLNTAGILPGIPIQVTGAVTGSYNPAHVLADLLFNPFPHGAGLDSGWFNLTTLSDIGTTLEAEGVGISIEATTGEEVKAIIAEIMQDCGMFLVLKDGLINFRLIREPSSSIPVIDDDMLVSDEIEIEKLLKIKAVDELVFSFQDRERRFRFSTIRSTNGGQVVFTETKRGRTIGIPTAVDFTVAATIANRRAQEELAQEVKFELQSNHDTRNMLPGDPFLVAGINPILRLTAIHPDPYSSKVTIKALADYYGLAISDFTNPGAPIPERDYEPVELKEFQILERPFFGGGGSPTPTPGPGIPGGPGTPTGGGGPGSKGSNILKDEEEIILLPIRDKEDIIGYEVYLSEDDITYDYIGSRTSFLTGGLLKTALNATTFYFADGIEFLPEGVEDDLSIATDLSTNEKAWGRGQQICIVGGEICYVQKIEPVGGGSDNWVLKEVLRCRDWSKVSTHAVNTPIFIGPIQNFQVFRHRALFPDRTFYVKTQPFTTRGGTDLSLETAKSIEIYGYPVRPPIPAAIRLNLIEGRRNVFVEGVDLVFEWFYKSDYYPRTGAGKQEYGEKVLYQSPTRGLFKLVIMDNADNVLFTFDELDTTTKTVLWSDLETAYGGVPDEILVFLTEIAGNSESDYLFFNPIHYIP
jgi:hypothetical protein